MITRKACIIAMAALTFGLIARVQAQSYPDKPIKLVLPYTAGSPNDVIARLAAPALSDRLGQPIVIDNRPGGGTTIGAKAVRAAEPDGYTLLFTNTPTHVIAPLISKGVEFDPLEDFTPITTIASTVLVLVIATDVPASSVQDFVRYAKANPGKLNFGFGQGTLPHLVGELFKATTATDIVSIPYKGGAQAVTDMLGGRIHMNLGATVTLVPLIRAGKLKALAVTGMTRHADLPEVPTMAESGFPDVTTVTYYGLMGPAGIPADIVHKLNRAANDSLKSPELTASMEKLGFGPKGGAPADFAALLFEQTQKWAPVVKALGFKME